MIKFAIILSMLSQVCLCAMSVDNLKFNEIDMNLTCVDEYIQRDTQLKKWLLWSPPLAIASTPVAFVGGVAVGSIISNTVGVGGWAQLGAAIGGGMILSGAAALSGITIEVITAVKFNRNRTMLRAIVESQNNNLKGRNLNRLTRIFNRKYDRSMSVSAIAKTIRTLDRSGELCDGRLKEMIKSPKLKHLLAKRKDLFRYLK